MNRYVYKQVYVDFLEINFPLLLEREEVELEALHFLIVSYLYQIIQFIPFICFIFWRQHNDYFNIVFVNPYRIHVPKLNVEWCLDGCQVGVAFHNFVVDKFGFAHSMQPGAPEFVNASLAVVLAAQFSNRYLLDIRSQSAFRLQLICQLECKYCSLFQSGFHLSNVVYQVPCYPINSKS